MFALIAVLPRLAGGEEALQVVICIVMKLGNRSVPTALAGAAKLRAISAADRQFLYPTITYIIQGGPRRKSSRPTPSLPK